MSKQAANQPSQSKPKRSPNTMPEGLTPLAQAAWAERRLAAIKEREQEALHEVRARFLAEEKAILGQCPDDTLKLLGRTG